MRRILFTLQYLGTRYAGWQRQTNAVAVQQVFEDALRRMFRIDVTVHSAGRTDSGVHARAQRAHADLPFVIEERGLIRGLNDLLPRDVRITEAREVDPAFHCRFEARGKHYSYWICNSSVEDPFLSATHAWVPARLEIARMRAAAAPLIGRHDFRSFTVLAPEVSSTERTLHALAVQRQGEVVRIDVEADGFLRFMVRRIAGLLIEVGRGKLEPESGRRALEPEFGEARWTAPPHGLFLEEVFYESIPFLSGGESAAGADGWPENAVLR
ncbi:MAG: tRNA pseudouridine(38-40) synthase TruA [Thermoanaerobaculia bacterium]